jgi:primosomal protein N' (replication factor Y)
VRVARVIVDVRARSLDRVFDYRIPERLSDEVSIGVPVVVPFGSRVVGGYVVELADASPIADLKHIEAVVGGPLFAPHALDVARWIASHYVCGLADAIRPFLPPGGAPRIERSADGTWALADSAVTEAVDRWVWIAPDADADSIAANATRQRAVLDSVADGPVRTVELTAELGDVSAAISRLAQLGLVRIEERRRFRRPDVRTRPAERHGTLTTGQASALEAIAAAPPGGCVLLDGVTGSGKTEVYMRAIEDALDSGLQAIVLVPEISLTPQTVGRFRARFGEDVAVLHSRLSAGERADQWELARRSDVSVVIGPRSALFAPLSRLGVVVLDEEHEPSYKQGSTPRYHARSVAQRICAATGARLVLGSATPSLESRHAAAEGRISRVRLDERATGAAMPRVEVVDMGSEFSQGNRSMFSSRLRDELARVETRKEKAVLFLNRRGFASFLLCRECGHVPTCDSCAVSMTYHEVGSRLACHHCASVRSVPNACPECGSPYLRRFGAGTQRVEAELASALPNLPVVRMDADTTRRKGGHEARLAEFEALESGILLGTQMIAKGLDYPEVTLVGVLGADLGLRMPDFRAGERTYQLLEQVAGRAGRADREGLVVIQTYWPEHPAVRAAASHDPEVFYAAERRSRESLGYPPYARLARVLVTGRDADRVREDAERVADALRVSAGETGRVVGPSPAPIPKIKGTERWHLLLKTPLDVDLSAAVREAFAGFAASEGVTAVPDIDPVDVL